MRSRLLLSGQFGISDPKHALKAPGVYPEGIDSSRSSMNPVISGNPDQASSEANVVNENRAAAAESLRDPVARARIALELANSSF